MKKLRKEKNEAEKMHSLQNTGKICHNRKTTGRSITRSIKEVLILEMDQEMNIVFRGTEK